jgi:16S rRNA C1402 (ribose-2'-O) methylase RsmI
MQECQQSVIQVFALCVMQLPKAVEVSVIPGPSAVTMAVALSGLATDRFSFEGFPPRTAGARLATFEKLRFEERTMVFFEAPHRLVDSSGRLRKCIRGRTTRCNLPGNDKAI